MYSLAAWVEIKKIMSIISATKDQGGWKDMIANAPDDDDADDDDDDDDGDDDDVDDDRDDDDDDNGEIEKQIDEKIHRLIDRSSVI